MKVKNTIIVAYSILNLSLLAYLFVFNPLNKPVIFEYGLLYIAVVISLLILLLFFPKRKHLIVLFLQLVTTALCVVYFLK